MSIVESNIRPATPFARQRILLDFVIRNPGRSQQQIAAGVRRFMTRNVAARHLKEMAANNAIVEQQAPNGSAYGYYAEPNNPLVIIDREVYGLEPALRALARKAALRLKPNTIRGEAEVFGVDEIERLVAELSPVFELFRFFVDFYLSRATIEWRFSIANGDVRNWLYAMTVEAIAVVQEAIFDELKRAGMSDVKLGLVFAAIWGTAGKDIRLDRIVKQLEKRKMKKEALKVVEKMPRRLKRPKVVLSYRKVGGKPKIVAKKRLNEDGSVTRLR